MGAKEKTETIDGHTFRVLQLGFSDGQRGLLRLGKVIGPSLGKIGKALGGNVTKEKLLAMLEPDGAGVDAEALGDAFGLFLASISEEDLEWFNDAFGQHTFVRQNGRGDPVPLNANVREVLFAGEFATHRKWFTLCLRHNFASFFGGLRVGDGGAQAVKSST